MQCEPLLTRGSCRIWVHEYVQEINGQVGPEVRYFPVLRMIKQNEVSSVRSTDLLWKRAQSH